MSNIYFTPPTPVANGQTIQASHINNLSDAVDAAFDLAAPDIEGAGDSAAAAAVSAAAALVSETNAAASATAAAASAAAAASSASTASTAATNASNSASSASTSATNAATSATNAATSAAAAAAGTGNYIYNGHCTIAQGSSKSLSTTAQVATVDMFACLVSGGTVGAGSIDRTTDAASWSGWALSIANASVTTGGTASTIAKHRIEANQAIRLKNRSLTVSLQVSHDIGSSINYVITIRKPTAANNYASTTTIATSSNMPVNTGTATLIAFAFSSGDCSNGLEIEVAAQTASYTTKSFKFFDWKLEPGGSATAFIPAGPTYQEEFQFCQQYQLEFEASVQGYNVNGVTIRQAVNFPVRMFASPTLVTSSLLAEANVTGITFNGINEFSCFISATTTSTSDSYSIRRYLVVAPLF